MNKDSASFRDPMGFIFYDNKIVYRAISKKYADDYKKLMDSGLYEELTRKKYLIPHHECPPKQFDSLPDEVTSVICPEQIPFISYPYEWGFSQLKDAALLTLKIQRIALKHGMILKDASAYNVQFLHGRPVFIDTLSFQIYKEGEIWSAYHQFCKHFLAPLFLLCYTDLRSSSLLKNFIDGIPLDFANKLLPLHAKIRPSVFFNICMQTYFSKKYESKDINFKNISRISLKKLLQMNEQLQDILYRLKFPLSKTEWGKYYTFTNYNDEAFNSKKILIQKFLDMANPASLWDLGANNGLFTRIAANKKIPCIAFDIDPVACEDNYINIKRNNEEFLLPLLLDLTNPSPAIGFANKERLSITERKHPDCIMALALIHHLAISNNVPLEHIAEYFSQLTPNLILEFVPKEDSQVKKLLSTREDIFPNYTVKGFEKAFLKYFTIEAKEKIEHSERILYYLKRK